MPGKVGQAPYICVRCLQASARQNVFYRPLKTSSQMFSQLSPLQSSQVDRRGVEDENAIESQILEKGPKENSIYGREQGAMSRRLSQATEDAIFEGGRAGRKAVEEAGFSEELKAKLLEKLEAHKFRSQNATAFVQAGLSSHVGRGSQDIATAQSWAGSENPEDTMLRMLDDARKPLKPELRGSAKIPSPIVDLRLKREPKQTSGQRLANARDKTSIYASSKDTQMTDKEREEMRKELKERFTPGARAMPNSIRGLAALANERIEDAIARGQFKNIPRGKAIQRDARADNPFIDTTEYILNKMIQRQDIVPPWIEKQQELVKAANVFRLRLRNDCRSQVRAVNMSLLGRVYLLRQEFLSYPRYIWDKQADPEFLTIGKRQAARSIASRGGSLQEQMRLADTYAESERINNPKKTRAVEQIAVPTNFTDDHVIVNVVQESPSDSSSTLISPGQASTENNGAEVSSFDAKVLPSEPQTTRDVPAPNTLPETPLPAPFRIPSWEAAEMSYLKLAVSNLNSLTRSYNLMAPDLAKKPYFSLDRELRSCYSDVAPQLSQAIKERAAKPARDLVEKIGHRPGSVLERFGGEKAQVYDSKKPHYGFKEFWNDLFAKES